MSWRSARNTFRLVVLGVLCASAMSVVAQSDSPQRAAKTTTQSTKISHAELRVQDRTFQSAALARAMTYRVLLPKGYAESSRRYPVLYLLHGWNGSYKNWETLTKLDEYAETLQLIVVMPDGENSWYVNSATVPANRFEPYIAEDLIAEVDEHWRTLRAGHHRAIAGLSMGGYGALKIALRHPGMFAAALSLSGAFQAGDPALEAEEYLKPSLLEAFGPEGSSTRRDNDLYSILKNVPPEQVPYLFVGCGAGDRVHLPANRKLAAVLSERGLHYEYHETAGRHDWPYWDEQLPSILKVADKILR